MLIHTRLSLGSNALWCHLCSPRNPSPLNCPWLPDSYKLHCTRKSACNLHAATIAPLHGTFFCRKEDSAPKPPKSNILAWVRRRWCSALSRQRLQSLEVAHEIHEAAGDASGLPKKLRLVAEQIPLVYNALRLAEQNL